MYPLELLHQLSGCSCMGPRLFASDKPANYEHQPRFENMYIRLMCRPTSRQRQKGSFASGFAPEAKYYCANFTQTR